MLCRLSFLLGLSFLFCFSTTSPVIAGSTSFPSTGNSGNSGSRCPQQIGSCATPSDVENPLILTPIVPQNQIINTEKEQVNLYVYIPPQTNKLAFLEVVDMDSGELVFEQEFDLKTADTIARLVLPESVQLLPASLNESRYHWQLWIYCDPMNTPSVFAEGWINRWDASDAASRPRLWHEELEAWFAERETNPEAWQQGLAAENLGDYADRPVETYFLGN